MAKVMRNEVVQDKHDVRQILTFLLSKVIDELVFKIDDKTCKTSYS